MFINSSGLWKKVDKAFINVSNVWKQIDKAFINVGNIWKQFFAGENVPSIESQVTISQSSPNATTALITLTGRNFHWTNALTLTYYFEWSTDGGSNWTTLSTGNINNPASGTFNEVTHIVTSAQTSPNIDNLYRFRVFAVNIVLTNSSTSTSTTISTPRNITWAVTPITSILYNSATLNFSGGLYSNSYSVRIVNTSNSTTSYQTISGSPGTISGLSSSSNYTVYLTGYTGSSANGYPGNESIGQSFITPAPPTPSPTSSPSIPTGTPSPFNQVTIGNSGTYNNIGNDPGIVTKSLVKILAGTTITQGSTTALGTVQSSPYTVSQSDATIPKVNFYTRDNVIGLDNNTYYYYSPALASFLGTISDNFNRTAVPSGLGISTSGYDYNSYNINPTTWSTNGSFAVSSQSIPSGTTNSANFAMDTFETNSANNSISMGVTAGNLAGYGASVWVTSASNWWAVISTYDAIAYTKTVNTCTTTTCYGANCCPATVCSTCTYLGTEILCVAGQGTVVTDNNPSVPSCSGLSGSCGNCTLSSTTNLKAYLVRASSLTTTRSYTVRGSSLQYDYTYPVNQSSTVYSWFTIIQTGTTTNQFGEQVPVYGCSGTGSGSSCPTQYTTVYNASTVGQKCSLGCTSSTQTTCTGSGSCTGQNCYLNASGRCGDAAEDSYYPCNVAASTTGPCPTAGNGPGQRCTDCVESSSYECNVYAESSSCPGEGSGPGQRCSACEDITRRTYTYPKNIEYDKYQYGNPGTTTENGFTYNTRLQLVSSASGTVSYPTWNSPNQNGIIKTVDVAGTLNNNNFVKATGLYIVTSGDTITADGSNANNDIFTQLIKTTSGVTKTEADGSSSAGIIKGHTASLSSDGRVDNLQIN